MLSTIFIIILVIIITYILILIKNKKEHFNQIKLSPKLSANDIEDLNKGHVIMTNMLREFDKICRDNNLKYWCIGGTLIGAIRHNGWVPWDGDVDIGMLEEDYIKLKKIIKSKLPKTMWFQDKDTDKFYKSDIGKIRYLNSNYKDYNNQSHHNGLQLDIFTFKHNKNQIYGNYPVAGIPDVKKRNYDDIFPLQELKFESFLVYVPNKYKKISSEIWGGYPPEIPNLDKRYPHEGRFEFKAPQWMKDKYPKLYKK